MPHADPRILQAEGCVFRHLLDRHAAEQPDKVFARFATDEPDWTYADLKRKAIQTANALAAAGVRQGDHVVSWLQNGPTAVRLWIAANYLGAVHVPLNLAYRGGILQHALHLADARVLVTHAELVERLAEVDPGPVRTVFALGTHLPAPITGLDILRGALLAEGSATNAPPLERPIEPWHTQAILFTSGTTGPSKAVLSSNMHMATLGRNSYPTTTPSDRGLIHTPLFHITGMSNIAWAMVMGGSIAVLEQFSTATFWRDTNRVGATFFVLMGSIATFLSKLPPSDDEKRTTLRLALLAPLNAESTALCRRLGLDFYSVFNMTETSVPLVTAINPTVPNTCGRPRPGIEARLVDANDCEVPVGTVGELIVRSDTPWTLNSGYYKNAEATAHAWRNGWFRTGDACRKDANGDYYYVDRVKDSIRRRGENISSYEVEIEILAHPDVKECAAVAVPSEFGEDDVMIVVAPQPGKTIDPAELLHHAVGRMAYYMVPRYIRTVDDLPKTPTMKVQKAALRSEGLTPDTWDREAAGLSVKRDRIAAS